MNVKTERLSVRNSKSKTMNCVFWLKKRNVHSRIRFMMNLKLLYNKHLKRKFKLRRN